MIKNISHTEIKKDKNLYKNFLSASFNDIGLSCNIYKGNFYLDSYNYFLINEEYKSFDSLFTRDNHEANKHFYTKNFYENFQKKLINFKEFKNIFVLGSNAGNNYYSNLLQFLPRIFFLENKKIKIAIHRNSSTKFRNFIKLILDIKKIQFSFIYLDDDFYKFSQCEIPQFLELRDSIKILKKFLIPKNTNIGNEKIYVTREDSSYRKIVNEADIVPILKSKGYKVINPQLYSVDEQIEIFSSAKKIITPHGSNLTNIIFCQPGTQIFEIGPKFEKTYEKVFENRYRILAQINNLNYFRFISDTVAVKEHSDLAKKYIDKKILDESNYYKNLIVKIKEIEKII